MDIVEPKTLTSLSPLKISIRVYKSPKEAPGLVTLESVYGFTTFADLKRQIWLSQHGTPEWAPTRIFIAKEQPDDTGLYTPLDMTWGDQTDLINGVESPFKNPGKPNPHLVDSQGNKKAVYPTINEGALIETVFHDPSVKYIVDVWTLDSLVQAIDTTIGNPGVFDGYIKLYFPRIESIAEAKKAKTDSYPAARDYIVQRVDRIKNISKILSDEKIKETEGFHLDILRMWKGCIAEYPGVESKSLEMLFYEFKTSKDLPFLRYYPEKGRGSPLLKLATGPSGFPVIKDKGMLATFMSEEPPKEYGAVLIAKIPFTSLATQEIKQKQNVALTISWFNDLHCSCSVILEAPRKDMPLGVEVVREAQTLLRKALASLYPKIDIDLVELSAEFSIHIKGDKKLEKKDLLERVPFFSPFLEESTSQYKDATKLQLKWKAVNNYEQEGAVFSYLTKLVNEEDEEGDLDERFGIWAKSIAKEFDRSEKDAKALVSEWYRRRSEVVPAGDSIVSANNTGVDIDITISHPIFKVAFIGIDSKQTFERVTSIVKAFLYYPTPEPALAAVPEAPKAPVVEAMPKAAVEAKGLNTKRPMWQGMIAAMAGMAGEEESGDEEEDADDEEAPQAKPVQAAFDGKKTKLEPLNEFHKKQLDYYDAKLFGYSQGDKLKVYSRTCQASSARQPNVLVAEQVDELMRDYGTDIEWVFLPPPTDIILNVKDLDVRQINEALTKNGLGRVLDEMPKKKKEDLKKILEDHLCTLPGPQGQFCKIFKERNEKKPGYVSLEEDFGNRPLWYVARAGSNPEKPLYFICAEYWCVKDKKPILPSEYKATKTRAGLLKEANSCPFCGGKEIFENKSPKMGETVLRRKEKSQGVIHDVVGYINNIHPQKFALPCCFTGAKISQAQPDEGTIALPVDKRGIRTAQEDAGPIKPKAEAKADEDGGDEDGEAAIEVEAYEDDKLTKNLRKAFTEYVLGADSRQLGAGKIALCPQSLDQILGQDSSKSVGKIVGVAQHFKSTVKTFARFGLGNHPSSPGLSFLELLGFYLGNLQRAGKAQMKGAKFDLPTIIKPAAVLNILFPDLPEEKDIDKIKDDKERAEKKETLKFLVKFRRAFERANYGNLVQEFAAAAPKEELTQYKLERFAREQGFVLPFNRDHIERFARAWFNFVDYMKSYNDAKDLRYLEGLFAQPDVIFPQGLLLVIFEAGKDADGNPNVRIRCPDYGVSEYSQKNRPPVAFIWHEYNVYEPLIYIEGLEKQDKKGKQESLILTTLHAEDPKFTRANRDVQQFVSDFITQFISSTEGCGRFSSPSHPWMPDISSSNVPKISELLSIKASELKDHVCSHILRDRSNRLVGVIYTNKADSTEVFVPALEDGSMGLNLKTKYDVEGLPIPTLEALLTFLMPVSKKGFASKFIGLKPVGLRFNTQGDSENREQKFCALELSCGALIPFVPFEIDKAVRHYQFAELKKHQRKIADYTNVSKGLDTEKRGVFPWYDDIRFLSTMGTSASDKFDVVPESIIEESYYYLRISLSEWLQQKDRDAKFILKQLRALRTSKLPLYELRRRADILLEPLIHNWIDVSKHDQTITQLSLLRKNCIVEHSEGTCKTNPLCSWVDGGCKIHPGKSEKIPDVKVYFTNRIVDELMRYSASAEEILNGKVPRIRAPMGSVKTADTVITSKYKIRDLRDEFGLDYVPKDEFTAGLTYPEDIHDDELGRPARPDLIELPLDWMKTFSRAPLEPDADRIAATLKHFTKTKYSLIVAKIIEIKKKKGLPETKTINWNDADWFCLAEILKVNIIITEYNNELQTTRPTKRFRSDTQNYMVVFIAGKPEVLVPAKIPILQKHLPTKIQTWLDSSFALTWDQAKE